MAKEEIYKIVRYNAKGNITKKSYYKDVKQFEKQRDELQSRADFFKFEHKGFDCFKAEVEWKSIL